MRRLTIYASCFTFRNIEPHNGLQCFSAIPFMTRDRICRISGEPGRLTRYTEFRFIRHYLPRGARNDDSSIALNYLRSAEIINRGDALIQLNCTGN